MKKLVLLLLVIGTLFAIDGTAAFNCGSCCTKGQTYSANVEIVNDHNAAINIYAIELRLMSNNQVFGTWTDLNGQHISVGLSGTYLVSGLLPNENDAYYFICAQYEEIGGTPGNTQWDCSGTKSVHLYDSEVECTYNPSDRIETNVHFRCQDGCCFSESTYLGIAEVTNNNPYNEIKVKKIELKTKDGMLFGNYTDATGTRINMLENDAFEISGELPETKEYNLEYDVCVYFENNQGTPYEMIECEPKIFKLASKTSYECETNDDCKDNEYCYNAGTSCYSKCREVETHGTCGKIEHHAWTTYTCCSDTECGTGKICYDHACMDKGHIEVEISNDCPNGIIVTVTDSVTGPIQNAYVTVDEVPFQTDASGQTSMNLNYGTHRISVYASGYTDGGMYETDYDFNCNGGITPPNGNNGGKTKCTTSQDCADTEYCRAGECTDMKDCTEYQTTIPPTVNVGDNINIQVNECGKPSQGTTVTITDPNGEKKTIITDEKGRAILMADNAGVYDFKFSKNGTPIASGSTMADKTDTEIDKKKKRGIIFDDEKLDYALLIVVVITAALTLVYLRTRPKLKDSTTEKTKEKKE
ncbi:MAG: carboxypeptidase-like regulatory domain-containing protein [Candidatus Micrarchaeota archaeon]